MLRCRKFPLAEKSIIKRGGEYQDFSSSWCRKFFYGNPKFMDRRWGGGGKYQDFSVRKFVSRSSKIFRRESSNVLLISGFEKI